MKEDTKPKTQKLLSPMTSVLILTRLRAHSTRLADDTNGKVPETLFKLKTIGLAESHIRQVRFRLLHIARIAAVNPDFDTYRDSVREVQTASFTRSFQIRKLVT